MTFQLKFHLDFHGFISLARKRKTHGCQEQLIQIREAGLRQVPLIFLCINGEKEKVERGDETLEAPTSAKFLDIV